MLFRSVNGDRRVGELRRNDEIQGWKREARGVVHVVDEDKVERTGDPTSNWMLRSVFEIDILAIVSSSALSKKRYLGRDKHPNSSACDQREIRA